MEEERDAAEKSSSETPILVILGNPPYNGFAGVADGRGARPERRLPHDQGTAPAPQGQGLNDLYVRFFRMAERRIVEKTGKGIVCFISNYSWLDGLSFTGMRERYLEVFDHIWIDCLNGDKYKTGKLTPEGTPDPSVFSTESNREGIQVGTAIALLIRNRRLGGHDFGLLPAPMGEGEAGIAPSAAGQDNKSVYERLTPPLALGLPFAPAKVGAEYLSWPLLNDLFATSSPGVNTSRDLDLVEIDLVRLQERMASYFDDNVDDERLGAIAPSLLRRSGRYDPKSTRRVLVKLGIHTGHFVPYAYRPFDVRNLYWHPETKLLDEKRDDLFALTQSGTMFLTSRQKAERQIEGTPFYVTRHLPDRHLTRPGAVRFPLLVPEHGLFGDGQHEAHLVPNLSSRAAAYLSDLGVVANTEGALWMHALAIGNSPLYLSENADGMRQDWPRVPLPAAANALMASASLGQHLVSLLDPDCGVEGVTVTLRSEIMAIGSITGVDDHFDAEQDLAVTAGWGNPGKGGVTMPGHGRVVERPYTPQERAAIEQGVRALGIAPEEAVALLGDVTLDVYLNDRAYWKNVPVRVWEYTIGGYQVIKKWLSYRETKLLGRSLTPDEARYVMTMARRIAAILLLTPTLNANYEAVKRAAYPWRPEPR